MGLKKKAILYVLYFVVATVSFDFFFFRYLFLRIPNTLEWDSSHWYNFEHNRYWLKDKKNLNLVAGSSIALYGLHPSQISESFPEKNYEFYSHVAMTPSDFYYYTDDILTKKPESVTYLINPADFQLENLHKENGSLSYDTIHWREYMQIREPTRKFYSLAFVKDFFWEIKKEDIYKLLTYSLLYVIKYRDFFWDPVDAYFENNYRKQRSYHFYRGMPTNPNVSMRGLTPLEFDQVCEKEGDEFFTHKPNTSIVLTGNFEKTKLEFPKPGWYRFQNPKGYKPGETIHWSITPGISSNEVLPGSFGIELQFGVRFSGFFCKKNPNLLNSSYSRITGVEESRLENFTDNEYDRDYFLRFKENQEKRKELFRLYKLEEAKKLLASSEFQTNPELEYLKKAIQRLTQNGIRVVLINSPENPLELQTYVKGKWYAGYLQYLQNISKERYTLWDAKEVISNKKRFYDPHHLTYIGATEFTSRYIAFLKSNLEGSK